MARAFNGSSDAVTSSPGASINGSTTLAVSFWLNWTTFSNNDSLAMEYSTNYFINTGGFIIDPNGSTGGGGGFFEIAINTGGAAAITLSYFTRPSAGVFHQYVVNYNTAAVGAAQVVSVYVDGTSQSLTNQFAGNGNSALGNYSLYFMSRAAASLFASGSLADVAIYNVNLTAGEASALANGARPIQIRPKSLVTWLPLGGIQSPEPDISGNAFNGTLTGTAPAFGPPLLQFTPRWQQGLAPVAAPTFSPAWARNRNTVIQGVAT